MLGHGAFQNIHSLINRFMAILMASVTCYETRPYGQYGQLNAVSNPSGLFGKRLKEAVFIPRGCLLSISNAFGDG